MQEVVLPIQSASDSRNKEILKPSTHRLQIGTMYLTRFVPNAIRFNVTK